MDDASIVFRTNDMREPSRICVNTLSGASELAARFRNAAHRVEVMDHHDEIVHRWEDGNPDWETSGILLFHRGVSPVDFERKGDRWWVPENRARELSEMLAFAFDVAISKESASSEYCYIRCAAESDWTLQNLVDEAEAVRQSVSHEGADAWDSKISDWMRDQNRLFVKYLVEYSALTARFALAVPHCRVWELGDELAKAKMGFQTSDVKPEH